MTARPRSYVRERPTPHSAGVLRGEVGPFAGPWVERRIRTACRHGVTRPWSCPECEVARQPDRQP
jgi:hypothetical protein